MSRESVLRTDWANGRVVATVALAAVAAAAVGLGAGRLGWPLLIIIAVVPVAVAVFYRPYIGVVLLAATIPMENILNFDGLGLGRAIGVAVFGAWFVGKIAKRQSWGRVVSGAFFPTAIAFLVWILASMLWAEHRPVVRTGFIRIAQMVALAFIIIDIVDSGKRLDLLAKGLVLSGLVAAGTILYQAEILGVRRLGGGVAGGINDTAAVLLTIIPLSFYLLRTSRSFIWGLVGTLYFGMGAVAVAIMSSRLNLLLLPPLIGILYLLAARDRRGRRWLAAVTVAGALGAVLFIPWEKVAGQAATIGSYVNETAQFGQVQAETSPRGYHMRIGLAIARDHPLIGVGYGNYGHYFRDEYQFQVPGGPKLFTSVRSPHSSYVGIAADLGAIGLLTWLLLLGLAAASAIRAWLRARAAGARDFLPMIEALVLMIGLHIFAYGFYAPNQTDKLLWIIIGMCFAVRYVVEAAVASAGGSIASELEPPRAHHAGGSSAQVGG